MYTGQNNTGTFVPNVQSVCAAGSTAIRLHPGLVFDGWLRDDLRITRPSGTAVSLLRRAGLRVKRRVEVAQEVAERCCGIYVVTIARCPYLDGSGSTWDRLPPVGSNMTQPWPGK